jgi:aminoglycoside phosphotransferase (APT) family kinase protein
MSEFEERLTAVLSRAIPGFVRLVNVERLSGGASQETYRIDLIGADGERALAMRRAPGGAHVVASPGQPGLAAEALLMRSAKSAGVPEPHVYWVLTPEDGLGDGFIMEWLDGIALGAQVLRAPQLEDIRPRLAFLCGEILAKIHSIDLVSTGLDQHLGVLTPAEYLDTTWQKYRDYDTPQPMIDYTGRWLAEHLPQPRPAALVHNDFRNDNVMFDADGVVAVLDWEVAHIGDPMRDLGWICTNSWRFGRSDLPVGGFGTRDDLYAGYESIAGGTIDQHSVKWWEVFGSFWWAIGCLGMAEHYRTGPDNSVERPAIGRRSSECQVDCVNLLIPGPVELVTIDATTLDDMPRLDELLVSVRDFLRGDVMADTSGRTNFLARVAGNSLDIVLRELQLGESATAGELARLQELFEEPDADLSSLRWRLVNGLRDGSIGLEQVGLSFHLRTTAVNQLAIDQPKYSGFKAALAGSDTRLQD